MKIEKQVNALWSQFIEAVDASSHDGDVLHDYKTTSWHKNTEKLLAAAIASERGHRGFVGGPYPVSMPIGAKIILISNIADGAKLKEMPASTLWMTIRRDAAEAMTLGYLLRHDLTGAWLDAASMLDYSDIMKGNQVTE